MKRQELEMALTELYGLLDSAEAGEGAFQAWFERHPTVFTAYGYRRFIPKPLLEIHNNEFFIPDFIVEDMTGIWHIFELKRPDTPVLKPADRRRTFYADFEKYIAQCREYAEFFEDGQRRIAFNAKYSTAVQKSVPSVIIAGRRTDVDFAHVQKLLFDRGSKVGLQTYDDVATRLEFYRTQLFARDENNPGLSIHVIAVLEKQTTDNYLLDFGFDLQRNRVSVYVAPDDSLRFRVIDRDGMTHTTSVPFEKALFLYHVPVYLTFELGFADDYTFMCIEVNGTHFTDRRLDQIVLEAEALRWHVMGSNVLGNEPSEFSMIEVAVYSRSLSFAEKVQLRNYFFDRYHHCMGESGMLPARVTFSGHQFLYATGHPNFPDHGPTT
ncbi:MAG: DUF4263 domain-containing protein [Chloroflexi bacterium]|nr:DUF4263 domain-containing protein [Chloroflexota bacterium]MCI0578524.1 DUF4263 domain-containing protein [Chloroflexota bacterium]MCI0647186.1 DUF4263 domain-containing protein [Chloroflexota bacterium]MCI0727223.1 DUF4263 domain-containing protein [Chloroflexota bacterium]